MSKINIRTLAAATICGIAAMGASAALAADAAHVHMGHVSEAWGDTPDGMGFLPTAIAEAEIAVLHAGLAAKQPDNLDWMKTHAGHVLNAVDPSAMAGGPGLGYGVMAAAAGTAKHIGIAAASEGASENVKVHAVHISAPAENTLARVAEITRLVKVVEAATSAAVAADAVAELVDHTQQLLAGRDADGDGEVSWEKDEGGLLVAAKHMGFMRAGENL